MSASTLSRVLAVAVVAALSGCTLVVQGTKQNVKFDSEPPGATFTVAGQTATTPVTLELPKADYQIAFRYAGYEDANYELKRGISNWFIGSVVMGVISLSIDIASGAWKEFETTDVKVNLQALPDTVVELAVTVASEPPGADIVIGNLSYGTTPANSASPGSLRKRRKKSPSASAAMRPSPPRCSARRKPSAPPSKPSPSPSPSASGRSPTAPKSASTAARRDAPPSPSS